MRRRDSSSSEYGITEEASATTAACAITAGTSSSAPPWAIPAGATSSAPTTVPMASPRPERNQVATIFIAAPLVVDWHHRFEEGRAPAAGPGSTLSTQAPGSVDCPATGIASVVVRLPAGLLAQAEYRVRCYPDGHCTVDHGGRTIAIPAGTSP